ncbi:MAG: methyltransferase domain-containing protein [Micromonosporaceae bacterium]|jgi:ubiquinone/menaquinone biosynthesis C-methylase UbiE|nr:methyltransferase domain-containing protein [Micromonosporaceae bacterium]
MALATPADMTAYAGRKRELLGALTGTVLEIGAGAGANFVHFDRSIRWIGLEPDPRWHDQLDRAAAAHGNGSAVIGGRAEQIPLADNTVDAVVSTIVLCSVADQERVLAEVRRVLRPGGTFVFFEHVAAPGTWTRRLQRVRALCYSRRFDAGCDPSRETWRPIEAAGFRNVDLAWYARRIRFGVYNRYIAGQAIC